MRPRILTFAEHYLPGYKAGGPVQSLAGLVRGLGSELDFLIVTRDRDYGESIPYAFTKNVWHEAGRARVRYIDPSTLDQTLVRTLLRETTPDIIYLTGYFGPMTRAALACRRRSRTWPARTIVHPQGQFAPGALGLKTLKKRCYLGAARTLRLHDGVEWQASNIAERAEITKTIGSGASVHVVSDVFTPICAAIPEKSQPKEPGHARFLYLARVTPVKNLLFLLNLLHQVPGRIDLAIIGPVDDTAYWTKCQTVITGLPQRIRVEYHGAQPHAQVLDILAAHDFLVLPTFGENFGHAILEAFQAGLPVVVSDKTPWRALESTGSGWDLPLDASAWVRVMEACVGMDADQHHSLRLGATQRVSHVLSSGLDQNRAMFINDALPHGRFGHGPPARECERAAPTEARYREGR